MTVEKSNQRPHLNEELALPLPPEWDALVKDGWKFNKSLQLNPCSCEIAVQRGKYAATFRIDGEQSTENINSQLLIFCQLFAFASNCHRAQQDFYG